MLCLSAREGQFNLHTLSLSICGDSGWQPSPLSPRERRLVQASPGTELGDSNPRSASWQAADDSDRPLGGWLLGLSWQRGGVDWLTGWLASLRGTRLVWQPSPTVCAHGSFGSEKENGEPRRLSQYNKHSCGNVERPSHQTPLKNQTISCGLAQQQAFIAQTALLNSSSDSISNHSSIWLIHNTTQLQRIELLQSIIDRYDGRHPVKAGTTPVSLITAAFLYHDPAHWHHVLIHLNRTAHH